jgi:N-acetylglucosaminyldiphosphoundecaprenol N-acetyl-beta-D-mannosaminyltransferase
LVVGVGGSFDVVAGVTKRAPKLLQMTGLEWLYRLSQEPRRMLKRYAVGNTKFIILVIRSLASKKHQGKNVEDANGKN